MHGSSVQAILQNAALNYIDVYVCLGRWSTDVEGLLVNAGDNVNAVVTRDGRNVPAPISLRTFDKNCHDAWVCRADILDALALAQGRLTRVSS